MMPSSEGLAAHFPRHWLDRMRCLNKGIMWSSILLMTVRLKKRSLNLVIVSNPASKWPCISRAGQAWPVWMVPSVNVRVLCSSAMRMDRIYKAFNEMLLCVLWCHMWMVYIPEVFVQHSVETFILKMINSEEMCAHRKQWKDTEMAD